MKPARGKNSKRVRYSVSSSDSEREDESPLGKKPKNNCIYFSSGTDQNSHLGKFSEDEKKDEKFAKDLVSIYGDVERLRSIENEFHLEWRDRFEQFHRCQQGLYADLKKKIGNVEHRWSVRRSKVKKVEEFIDTGKALVAGASTPATTPSFQIASVRNPGLPQILKGEKHGPHLPQLTALEKGKQLAMSTVNGPGSGPYNYQSDSVDEDESIGEYLGDTESEHEEESLPTGVLDENGAAKGIDSWPGSPGVETEDEQQKLQNTSETCSYDQDRARSSVKHANQQSHKTTTPIPQNTPQRTMRQRFPKSYVIPTLVPGDDELLPPPKKTESDGEWEASHKSHTPRPAKGTLKKLENTGRRVVVGTPGGLGFKKTRQGNLDSFLESKIPTNQEKESDARQATPGPIKDRSGLAQVDQGSLSPQAALGNQPGTRPKNQSASPFTSVGVPSHLNKQRSPFKEVARGGNIRGNSRPAFSTAMPMS